MQHLSISLLLTAAAALAGAAPQAASTQAGNASDYVEFEAAYPPDSTFEFLQQQQHILERCDPNAAFPIVNGTSDAMYLEAQVGCFVANVTLECYNKGSNLQGFNPGVYYPDYQVRPVPCVEYGLTGS